MNSAPLVSVCIPAYEMHGRGAAFLARSLSALDNQTMRDFEVVVSDHSEKAEFQRLCETRSQFYPLRYVRFARQRGNSSANTNFAVQFARGDLIKIIHQDDFLLRADALFRLAEAIRKSPGRRWGGVGCLHVDEFETEFHSPHVPKMSSRILHGHNTFGAPSVMFVTRKDFLAFDEQLIWVSDCEVYYRMKKALGAPIILREALVAVRRWPKQVTYSAVTEECKAWEIEYALQKHGVSELAMSRSMRAMASRALTARMRLLRWGRSKWFAFVGR